MNMKKSTMKKSRKIRKRKKNLLTKTRKRMPGTTGKSIKTEKTGRANANGALALPYKFYADYFPMKSAAKRLTVSAPCVEIQCTRISRAVRFSGIFTSER